MDMKLRYNHINTIVFYIMFLPVIFMQKLYEGPDELVEKMKSLSLTNECFSGGEHYWHYDSLAIIYTFFVCCIIFNVLYVQSLRNCCKGLSSFIALLLSSPCRLPSSLGEFRKKCICAS